MIFWIAPARVLERGKPISAFLRRRLARLPLPLICREQLHTVKSKINSLTNGVRNATGRASM